MNAPLRGKPIFEYYPNENHQLLLFFFFSPEKHYNRSYRGSPRSYKLLSTMPCAKKKIKQQILPNKDYTKKWNCFHRLKAVLFYFSHKAHFNETSLLLFFGPDFFFSTAILNVICIDMNILVIVMLLNWKQKLWQSVAISQQQSAIICTVQIVKKMTLTAHHVCVSMILKFIF